MTGRAECALVRVPRRWGAAHCRAASQCRSRESQSASPCGQAARPAERQCIGARMLTERGVRRLLQPAGRSAKAQGALLPSSAANPRGPRPARLNVFAHAAHDARTYPRGAGAALYWKVRRNSEQQWPAHPSCRTSSPYPSSRKSRTSATVRDLLVIRTSRSRSRIFSPRLSGRGSASGMTGGWESRAGLIARAQSRCD